MQRSEYDVLLQTISEVRERSNMSQRAVGRAIGMRGNVYNRIESGERVLDVVEFVDIARAIGVDPLELFGTYLVEVQKAKR